MAVDKDLFRQALGHFATGVTVVTTRDADGKPQGLTVSAFSSLSLDPPLVLVCIGKNVTCYKAFAEGGVFAVNILSAEQELVSRRFASKEPDKFEGVAFRGGLDGAPVLDGAIANIECRIVNSVDGGDHTILVGQVENATVLDEQPLLYYRGGYARLSV